MKQLHTVKKILNFETISQFLYVEGCVIAFHVELIYNRIVCCLFLMK